MSILDCIVSYLKNTFKPGDEPDHVIESSSTNIPEYVRPLLQKVFWRVDSIAQGIVKPQKPADRITFIKNSRDYSSLGPGRNACKIERSIWRIERNILTFASAQGNVEIEISRLSRCSETQGYGMTYKGADGRPMFHTLADTIETENGYTVDQCRLAIIEFLDYLNDIIPATK